MDKVQKHNSFSIYDVSEASPLSSDRKGQLDNSVLYNWALKQIRT
jgi:hypothetical protein